MFKQTKKQVTSKRVMKTPEQRREEIERETESEGSGKKKRGMEGVAEIFSSSKKLARSPTRGKETDDKMEKVLRMLEGITQEVRREQKEYREEIMQLRRDNEVIKQENIVLRDNVKEMEERVESIEKDKRRKNIVIQGLQIETTDQNVLKVQIEEFMEKALQIQVDTEAVRKVANSICLVELKNTTDKERIMKNKSKLREVRESKIFINDDMSKAEREIQRRIRTKAKELRTEGKYVKIGYQKLIINNEIWKWNKDTSKLEKKETKKLDRTVGIKENTLAMDMVKRKEKDVNRIKNKIQTSCKNNDNLLLMGTWNIRSVRGKEHELVSEFDKARLDILVVTETKTKGNGIKVMQGEHIFIWSGVMKENRTAAGVGCLLQRHLKQYLSKWEAISERVLVVELKCERSIVTVIAAYGTSEDEKKERKEIFWGDLTVAIEEAKGIIYVVGDFNARVGKTDKIYSKVIGKHGEERRNEKWETTVRFLSSE